MTIFDRFIRYEWAEFALNEAMQKGGPSHIFFSDYARVASKSGRRTANILSNMWFSKSPLYQQLKEKALVLLPNLSAREHLALHWVMSLSIFLTI